MITIRTFNDYFSANLLLTRMRAEGIDCYLRDEYTVTIDPLLSNALGGIKLVVSEKELQNALSVLREFEKTSIKCMYCPQCKSTNISIGIRKQKQDFLTSALNRLFSNKEVITENFFRCNDCGFEAGTFPEETLQAAEQP